ncbi:hypothetical protein BDV29DRAFT_178706 [Aspergillus leporis]|uniref:Uncharacterized protein n=1 Tax=Aspergillus leporis TaxID=41062 RepID=A0A5N5WSZ4_9EURO|nr:hypothetical protein BDV29DRAFT_178706 [Aspergillus leporis]
MRESESNIMTLFSARLFALRYHSFTCNRWDTSQGLYRNRNQPRLIVGHHHARERYIFHPPFLFAGGQLVTVTHACIPPNLSRPWKNVATQRGCL